MSSFAQQNVNLTSFYQLTQAQDLHPQLVKHATLKKPILIIPALSSEFKEEENRPVFENILRELKGASYLDSVIIGVDRAQNGDVEFLARIIKDLGLKNYFIQHNDGPGFAQAFNRLNEAGVDTSIPGKGRNLFMSFGVAIAMGGSSIGLLDADIKTFKKDQLDRLFYPVQVLGYDFAKAFYARWDGSRMYGRVKRLLLDPLLLSLKRKFAESHDEKMLRLVDFLLTFNYQLSGEIVMDVDILKRCRCAMHWGIEIFTLIEVFRKAKQVSQVEFTKGHFDHKHQPLSADNPKAGLYKMAVDIVATLFNALIIEEGLEVSNQFFRDLAVTYSSIATDLVKKYSDNAKFNHLDYDRDQEEFMVRNVFAKAILYAGSIIQTPQQLTESLISFVNSREEFQPYIEQGFINTVLELHKRMMAEVYLAPEFPSWERVLEKDPEFLGFLGQLIKEEKLKYGPRYSFAV